MEIVAVVRGGDSNDSRVTNKTGNVYLAKPNTLKPLSSTVKYL